MFSLQSDVWSYGVVLWELFSLARSPYPGLEPNEEFVRKLELGHRMEKPEHATEEMWVADLEGVAVWSLSCVQLPSDARLLVRGPRTEAHILRAGGEDI